jgi:hypothetical protein
MSDVVPGDTSTTVVLTPSVPINGTIDTPNDTDWFSVTLLAGQTVQIEARGSATGHGSLVDPYLYLRDSLGSSSPLTSDDDSGEGLNARLIYTATYSGLHFVQVNAFAFNGTGTYQVSMQTGAVSIGSGFGSGNLFSLVATAALAVAPGQTIFVSPSYAEPAETVVLNANNVTINVVAGVAAPTVNLGAGVTFFTVNGAGNTTVNVNNAPTGITSVTSGAGAHILNGGAADDVFSGGEGDTVNGGGGFDIFIFNTTGHGAFVDFGNQANNAFAAQGTTFAGIEYFLLTSENDQFYAGASPVFVHGGAGNDILFGGAGSDGFVGGTGTDYFDGGANLDTVFYSLATSGIVIDRLDPSRNSGEAAGDYFVGIEGYFLTPFGDSFEGNDPLSFVYGGDGNDQMFGSVSSNDWFFGGNGDDFLAGGTLDDRLEGGAGRDVFAFRALANAGLDTIADFNPGDDVIQLTGANFGELAAGHIFTAGVDFIIGTIAGGMSAPQLRPTVLYDYVTGTLYFDTDGSGGDIAAAFAQLTGSPGLAASDLRVVALG